MIKIKESKPLMNCGRSLMNDESKIYVDANSSMCYDDSEINDEEFNEK